MEHVSKKNSILLLYLSRFAMRNVFAGVTYLLVFPILESRKTVLTKKLTKFESEKL